MSSKQDRQGVRTAADLERKYNWGQTFAEVYGLISNAQQAAAEAQNAVECLDSEAIFNRLTNYGTVQGIYRDGDDNIYVNADYIKSGKLAAEYIDVENLEVNAANVTGTLLADQFKLSGEMNIYDDFDSDEVAGKIGYFTVTVDGALDYVLGMYSATGAYLAGAGKGYFLAEDNITISTNGSIRYNCGSTSNHQFYGYAMTFNDQAIHVQSSDSRLKTDIDYNQTDKLVALFDKLSPVTFRMANFRPEDLHIGFVAQDIEAAVTDVGLAGALATKDCNGMYGLNYGEITAVLTAKIKQLEREIQEWKS